VERAGLGEPEHERDLGEGHSRVPHVAPRELGPRVVEKIAKRAAALLETPAEGALAGGHPLRDHVDRRDAARELFGDDLAHAPERRGIGTTALLERLVGHLAKKRAELSVGMRQRQPEVPPVERDRTLAGRESHRAREQLVVARAVRRGRMRIPDLARHDR
jgi:hypothetical protein